jgi:hypothetical protein
LRAHAHALVNRRTEIGKDIGVLGREQIAAAARLGPACKLLNVAAIRLQRVLREPLLQQEGVHELIDERRKIRIALHEPAASA